MTECVKRNTAISAGTLLSLYEEMVLIRDVESRLAELFNDGKIPGFIHLSIGQEATCVGVVAALDRQDTLASTHRGHGHCLAKGVDPAGLIHEILGHTEGVCKGRGGSLHVADFSIGMLGANGIVGAGIPIALGSALAHKTLKSQRVAVTFFGDGAMAEGALYESLNLAALWALPLLFVCENNSWSEFSPTNTQYVGHLGKLAASFGIRHSLVDGNDVEAVFGATRDEVAGLRTGNGPAVIECMTLRVRGHYEGDPQKYREGLTDRKVRDPLALTRESLLLLDVIAETIDAIDSSVRERVDKATAAALHGTIPRYEDALAEIYE